MTSTDATLLQAKQLYGAYAEQALFIAYENNEQGVLFKNVSTLTTVVVYGYRWG